ncbi:CPBP family intramembrane glutamic endopeptidase [Roseibium sp. M-1]
MRRADPAAASPVIRSKLLLAAELAVLIAGPVLLMGLSVQLLRFATIFLVALYAVWRLWANGVAGTYLSFNWTGCRAALPGIMLRWLLGSMVILAVVLTLSPERLFCIPRANPALMAVIVTFYGLVSVLPQEIAFRGYAAWRLDSLHLPFWAACLISAVLFGWVHILFGSMLSVALSGAAGLSFYRTYRKYRSLAAVWLEHSLLGISVFALGLDNLFYLGPASPAIIAVCGTP